MGEERSPDTMRNPLNLLFCALWIAACDKDKAEDLAPTGLEPLEDENLASAPSLNDDGSYPESMNVSSGSDDTYAWAHARAYVLADVAETWACFATPDVVVDRRRMESWTATMDVEDYDVSFTLDHVTADILTIEYQLTWIQGATVGTADAPEEVGIRWAKTAGSDLVYLLEGSAVLTSEAEGVTGVQLIEHLDTPGSGPEDVEAYFADLYSSVLACKDGEALPVYE